MRDINKQKYYYPCNNKKGRRFQIHLDNEVIDELRRIKTKREIRGSFQQIIYYLIKVYLQLDKYQEMIKEDPSFLSQLKAMNHTQDIIDVLFDNGYDERELHAVKRAVEDLLESKSFKK